METKTVKYINVNGKLMDLSHPQVMGILNVTPDSFYAGSRQQTEKDIINRTSQIIEEGASIIDIGAYSSRPNAEHISPEEEMRRLRTGLEIINRYHPGCVGGSLPSEAVDFSGRIKELRGDIIDAIRQLLHAHCMKEIRLPEEDYDPVWVIWFGKNGEPYECRVTGLRVTADSLTVLAEEKESGDEVQCHSPFELGAKNIDWLHEMYEAVWHQLRETNNVESQIEEP